MSRYKNKSTRQLSIQDEITEFLLYTAPGGAVKVEVILNDETLWLSQQRMAELFNVGVPAISKHLKNIFETGELEEDSVISILETTAADGKNYNTKRYNLTAINQHPKRIFAGNKPVRETTVKKYLTVQIEGNRQVLRKVKHYNLSTVIPAKLPVIPAKLVPGPERVAGIQNRPATPTALFVIPAKAGIQGGCLHG